MMALSQHPPPQSSSYSSQLHNNLNSNYNFMNGSGVFVHSNPPKPLISSSSGGSSTSTQNTTIRNWVKNGDIDKLENTVLEGQGARLLGMIDSTNDMKVKGFLRGIPGYMAKVDLIHDAVIRGSVRELQTLLDKKKLSLARDAVGRGLAHKAVLHSQKGVLEWLGKKYPDSLQIRDNESRTCLHYTGLAKNPTDTYNMLLNLGANPEVVDIHGRKASYYLTNPQDLYIEGVYNNGVIMQGISQQTTARNKSFRSKNFRNRRISPISPKSSPSPPIPSNNQQQAPPTQALSAGTIQQTGITSNKLLSNSSGSPITRAQIRIWIHEKDISKLENIVWSGNGDKLLLETTNNPKVKRFLENVPYLLHHIKLIHTAAIHNDVDGLKEIRSRIEASNGSSAGSNNGNIGISIGNELFCARDAYGLSPMHKAVGLNNRAVAEYLLYEFPHTLNLQDNFKRTPLHYGAARSSTTEQNNTTPDSIYKFLLRAGSDERILDYKHHPAVYYLTHSQDCDSFKFLRNIPDAPRVLNLNNNEQQGSKGLIGWDRSSVVSRVFSGNKRKISSSGDEFGVGGGDLNNQEEDTTKNQSQVPDTRDGSGGKIAKKMEEEEVVVNDEGGGGGGVATAVFEEEEEDVVIEDVGDGYVADSDEGKYDVEKMEVGEIFDVGGGGGGSLLEEEEEGEEGEGEREGTKNDDQEEKKELYDAVEVGRGDEDQNGVNNEVAHTDENGERKEPDENATTEKLQEEEEETTKISAEPNQKSNMDTQVPEEEEPKVPESKLPETMMNTQDQDPPPPTELLLIEDENPPDYYESVNALDDDEIEIVDPSDEQPEESIIREEIVHTSPRTVEDYIESADMESLVNLVLKGHGSQLVGKESSNPEIQEFLNNVPAYMAKIGSIHNAAYSGNMRDLQSLLDRKRLAEAQDIFGRGALHHAVLGGSSQVVRYLLNGYPQSISLPDHNNRTALHYAATLPDSGTLYKVLIQAGADPNVKDVDGNTPGIYLRRKDLLKIEDLLNPGKRDSHINHKIGGSGGGGGGHQHQHHGRKASSVVVVVKGSNNNNAAVDSWERPESPAPPVLANESTTMINRIKISSSNPSTPPPERMHNEDDDYYEDEDEALEVAVSNLSLLNSFYLEVLSKDNESIWSRTWKKLTSGNSAEVANKYVKKYLSPKVFHRVKMRCTPRYGSTLLDCIKFYPQFFVVAPDPHAYTSFSEVFVPAVYDSNGIKFRGDGVFFHPGMVFQGSLNLLSDYPIVDLPSKFVHQTRVRVSRNIRPFGFIPIMKREELYGVQEIVRGVFKQSSSSSDNNKYEWFDLEGMEKDYREELVESKGFWFPNATKISRFWPKGRGFVCNEDESVQVWVNAEDHVDIVCMSLYGKLGPIMGVVQKYVDLISSACEFHFNSQCGYLTVDPFRCGTAMKITFRLRLPNMMQNRSYMTQKCEDLKLCLRWKEKYRLFGSSNEISPDEWVEVENTRTCGVDENQICLDVIGSVNELIRDEEEMGRAIDRATTKKKDHGGSGSGNHNNKASGGGGGSRK